MSRQENQSVRGLTMGQGNLRRRRGPQSGGDARYNFKLDVGFAQGCDFFADASEDERVTALEAYDLQSRRGQINHKEVDLFLADVLFPAALAHVMNPRVSWHETEDMFPNQFVVEHNVCALQHSSGLQSE